MSKRAVRSFSRDFKLKAIGELALRARPGRPKRGEAVAMAAARGPSAQASDLAAARRQIAELERTIGQQHLDLDFFKEALRRIEVSRRPSDGPGATASSRASKR
jgi:hypothetical protein